MQHKVLTPIEDDTEEAPWMVMGMPQFSAATQFYGALLAEMSVRDHKLLVAGMLPIRYRPIPGGRVEQLAPDILVARVPVYERNSYDLDREGVPPAFVLEVVSPESRQRDLTVKPERYEVMGVEEYALFSPRTPHGRMLLEPPLQGHRRDTASGELVPWKPDESGRLYSQVLELWLVVRDGQLRAQRPDGDWVPTFDDLEKAEARAREYEAEVTRLRSELERLTGHEPS